MPAEHISVSDRKLKAFKKRLKGIAKKKFDTTMVFPISQFEVAFGHLWGHGLKLDELTKEQIVNRHKWEEIRQNIFNTGNQQMRNLFAELDLHDVIFHGYRYELKPMIKKPQNVTTGARDVAHAEV